MGNEIIFEDFKYSNGKDFWWATDFSNFLGYSSPQNFKKVIDRAIKAMMSLNISHYDNIVPAQNPERKSAEDFKLTRFACYIIAMNADPSKKQVAMAQAYFVEMTRRFEIELSNQQSNVERLAIREELAEGNKSLAGTIANRGVIKNMGYAKFQNAGYLGMYNMWSYQLEGKRDIPKGKLHDFMGRTELAANLFRVTQTEEMIKNKNIKGQKELEKTHAAVGSEIRNMVKKNTGVYPEELPQEKKLPDVKKELKQAHRKMQSISEKNKELNS